MSVAAARERLDRFRPTTTQREPRVHQVELAACLLVVLGLWYLQGWPGLVAGIVVALAWALLGTVVAIAIGHVLLVGLFPQGITLESLMIAEIGFVLLVFAPVLAMVRPRRFLWRTTLVLAGLAGVTWASLHVLPLWVSAFVAIGAVGLGIYGIHRFGLLALDRLPEGST